MLISINYFNPSAIQSFIHIYCVFASPGCWNRELASCGPCLHEHSVSQSVTWTTAQQIHKHGSVMQGATKHEGILEQIAVGQPLVSSRIVETALG
jgi:hypothetical protein